MGTTRTILPTKIDVERIMAASGLVTIPATGAQSLLDYDDAIGSAVREWEELTGYMPFLGAFQCRVFDPPGPERGPVGIYVGVNNMGGARKLFFGGGALSVSNLRVGVTGGASLLSGTVSGTVAGGAFTGTYTGALSDTLTFDGAGASLVTDGTGHTGTLTFAISGSGAGPTSITGVVDGNATGSVTGNATLTGTTAGSSLIAGTSYWLRPQNAPQFYRPYKYIEFQYPQWGNPQSILVTGRFGFSTTVPEDAWQAILYMAALSLLPSVELLAAGGLESVKLGNDSFNFVKGGRLYGAIAEQWTAKVSKIRGRYARVVMA